MLKGIEEKVQPYAARIFMTTSVIQSIVPAFCGSIYDITTEKYILKKSLIRIYLHRVLAAAFLLCLYYSRELIQEKKYNLLV